MAKERRLEMLHHPLTAVRAALAPTSRLTNLRQAGDIRRVNVTTARRKLPIDRVVPLHGAMVQPYGEFLKIVQQWSGLVPVAN